MRTAAECCNCCERLGNTLKKRKSAEKDFSIIEGLLFPDEDIRFAFNAFLNMKTLTKSEGLFSVAVTDRRIILAQKIAFSNEMKQIKIDRIIDSSFVSNSPYTGFSSITISTAAEEYRLTMENKSGPLIYNEFQALI